MLPPWNQATARQSVISSTVVVAVVALYLAPRGRLFSPCCATLAASGQVSPPLDIDGYKPELCGRVRLRKWQRRQNAFGCEPLEPDKLGLRAARVALASARPEGGRELAIEEMPFYAHLIVSDGRREFICAGTLVDYEFVLTTARCVLGAKKIGVILGTSSVRGVGGWVTTVEKWCYSAEFHPQLEPAGHHDVAVLLLKRRSTYTDAIQPACLPPVSPLRRHRDSAACLVARKRTNSSADSLQAHVVRRWPPADPLEWPDFAAYQPRAPSGTTSSSFCQLEMGATIVCYDACNKGSAEVQAFAVAAESRGGTEAPLVTNSTTSATHASDECNAGPPTYYSDYSKLSELIRSMTRNMIANRSTATMTCRVPEQ